MSQASSNDLTLSSARAQRDSLANRTDVLDKVKVLRTLPDDMHVTTEMVAEFYEVSRDAIWQLVKRNSDELASDGYRVLRPREVTDMLSVTPSELGLPNGTSQVALFPRRAVLRVGMLLRDSEVAKRVRTMLLDVEHASVQPLSGLEYALALVDAERRLLDANARAEEGAQFKRAIEAGDGLGLREFHKKYFSSLTETKFMEHLYTKNYLIDQRGKGTLREFGPRAGTYRDGSQHRHPSYKGKEYFYRHAYKDRDGVRRENTHVRPGKWELALRDALAKEGLPANETTASLFALESGPMGEIA
ncbi:hypothetical protein [Nocardia africana]